jgi:acetyl-CoA acetyltransferase
LRGRKSITRESRLPSWECRQAEQDEPGTTGSYPWWLAGKVPAMTVNRVCGSGAQAIVSAAQEVMLGMVDSAVAGGMENMDQALSDERRRWGLSNGRCAKSTTACCATA